MGAVSIRLVTPPPGPSGAAIAAIQIDAATAIELDRVLSAIGAKGIGIGEARPRTLAGIDKGVVVRWTPTCAHLMPHGGQVIMARILEVLRAVAGTECADPRATLEYPEAGDRVEACMLDAMARAASPLAIEVLLRQRDLWREGVSPRMTPADEEALQRLIVPPTVVLLGPPNIGKSTLTNALARRAVSIVADEPGTTRDHVGVLLDLAGLVVRWIDAPGIRTAPTDPIEREAARIALAAAASAELLLLCSDATAAFPLECEHLASSRPALRVALRTDLGPPRNHAEIGTSAKTGVGLDALATAAREALVPHRLPSGAQRWRFHHRLLER